MLTVRRAIYAAGLALALAAASHAPAHAQATAAHWRGTGNEQLLNQAVRRYGYRPNRLSDGEVRAINRAWVELLGPGSRRAPLNRAQATAIVYLALVEPREDAYAGRPPVEDYDRPGGGYGRPGDGYGRPDDGYGRPGYWAAACDEMEGDAYRLGNLVSAPRDNGGLFVTDPERGRARALARQIQEQAVQCRATGAADRAGEVLAELSGALPRRDVVAQRVDALKAAIQQASPGRRGR
jgi:hypothetical protein